MLRQEREDRENQRDKYRSVFDEAARQLEQDIDTEVQGMLKHYRAHLHSEKEATLGFKGQNGIMKKKFHALQKEIEEQGERREELGDKNGALREQIGALNREIDAHKKEIHQRDGTIGVKELEEVLVSLGLAENRRDVQKMINAVDTDASGVIEFPEYRLNCVVFFFTNWRFCYEKWITGQSLK